MPASTPLRLALVLMSLAFSLPSHAADDKPADKPADAPIIPPKTGKSETFELFNGKDLSGWKGHEKYWSVKDGVIVGKNTEPVPVSTYLLTDRNFSDFRLVFDTRLVESEMHSGIAMWGRVAPERGDPYTYAGHLVMFPSNYGFWDLYGRSSIHKNADIAKKVGKQHDWNHIEILAQGNRIRVVLNGTLISDWREPDPKLIHEAPLGLQLHSNKVPQEVNFKNLKIETFPEDKLTTLAQAAPEAGPQKFRVYVGTYTRGASKGIYRMELDLDSGKLSEPVLAGEAVNPSFVAIAPNRRFLYAVSEVNDKSGKPTGGVSAFAIDPSTGDLKLLNQQPSGGAGPCHVNIDRKGKYVLAANYTGGSAICLPIEADGRLGAQTGFSQHEGNGADPRRQGGPHAHSVNIAPDNRFAFVADLGLDRVMVYKLGADGSLTPNDPPAGIVAPGAGPRHFAFHPDGRHAYVINEMACTVTAFDYDPKAGTLKEIQSISTVPEGEPKPGYSTAEVQVHPSGKFLYGSNRGQNSIAIFTIDPASGKLTAAGHQGHGIKTPRNFGIDPTGNYLIAANQDGGSLVVFRINQQTGELTPTGSTVQVANPVCVKFVSLEANAPPHRY